MVRLSVTSNTWMPRYNEPPLLPAEVAHAPHCIAYNLPPAGVHTCARFPGYYRQPTLSCDSHLRESIIDVPAPFRRRFDGLRR